MSMQQDEDMLLQSIYEEYQGTLRRIARALNVPNMELEDVVQETFIAYFRKYSDVYKRQGIYISSQSLYTSLYFFLSDTTLLDDVTGFFD